MPPLELTCVSVHLQKSFSMFSHKLLKVIQKQAIIRLPAGLMICSRRRTRMAALASDGLRALKQPETASRAPYEASERADRTNAAGKILIIVVLAAGIGEVNVVGHVRAHLRRTPVATVIGQSLIAKVRGAGGLQVAIHQCQLVARRQEPAAHAIQAVVGA